VPVAPNELVVVGDRIFTDIVLAKRISPAWPRWWTLQRGTDADTGSGVRNQHDRLRGPLAVWTTGVWKREGTVMRMTEAAVVRRLEAWIEGAGLDRRELERQFVKVLSMAGEGDEEEKKGGLLSRAAGWAGSRIARSWSRAR